MDEVNGLLRLNAREPVTAGEYEPPTSFEHLDVDPTPPIDPSQQLRNIMDCILPPR
jgi:hypothetical protein